MENKKNKKKFSLAFKKEVALKAVSNKRKLEESKPADVWNAKMLKRENGQNPPVKLVIKL